MIARDVYLRCSPRGTAFRYRVEGDVLRLLCRWRHGRQDYTGVEVIAGRWAPPGLRGCVIANPFRVRQRPPARR